MTHQKKTHASEQRKYIRLKHVFPVQYHILKKDFPAEESSWHQGFTYNISEGGLCLSVNTLDDSLKEHAVKEVPLKLKISIPIHRPAIEAEGRVSWIEEAKHESPTRYLIGVEFTSIDKKDAARLCGYARWLKFSSRAVATLALAFIAAFGISTLNNFSLQAKNEALIHDLVTTQHKALKTSQELKAIAEEKNTLSTRINDYAREMDNLNEQLAGLQSELNNRVAQEVQEARLKELITLKSPLEIRFADLLQKENLINDQLNILERKKQGLQKDVLDKMYQWLKNHQHAQTGLVLSFEGSVGVIRHWAFSYDQALAVNAFLLFNDIDAGRKILSFFNRHFKNDFNGFANAYYYDSGKVAEHTVHCGPNIWVGLAALQYYKKTDDDQFLAMARGIGDWLIKLQREDTAGGLRGGPKFSWFATEHNLDAYAFFTMLYQSTGEEKYARAQKKVLGWLKKYAMTPHSDDYKSPPVKRGRGDATIATDTFSWSIAAIGPAQLKEMGMDPEQIMNFAEEHCAVTVPFRRPSGAEVEVSGFDFAKHAHMPRGGIVSPEWTAQMIVSYQIMGDYFLKADNKIKAGFYKERAAKYLIELNKLIISSPSPRGQGEGCLPYATMENADTGHGWRTPQGTRTGSIAGTAYMIMALKEFNPLMLEGK